MAGRPFRAARRGRHHDPMQPRARPADHVRVVLIDADDRVRESLCGLLCIGDRLEVVGSTGELGQAVDLVRATQPDVVLIDPRLTDVDDGVSFIERIRAAAPGVHVLVLTAAEPAGEVAGQPDVAAAATGSSARPSVRTISSPPFSPRPADPSPSPRTVVC